MRIEARQHPAPRIVYGPDRRVAAFVAGAMIVYAAMMLAVDRTGAMDLGLKGYVILGAAMLAPWLMLALAFPRTFRLEAGRLHISGPFGLGGRNYDAAGATLERCGLRVFGQFSYRLTWSLPDGSNWVMCTVPADRLALVEALHAAMPAGSLPSALKQLTEVAATEMGRERQETRRFAFAASVSLLAATWWLMR